MPTEFATYFAWIKEGLRPLERPDGVHKQLPISAGTKVSVMEEYTKDFTVWCRLAPPPNSIADDHYPELWVPRTALTMVDPKAPAVPPPQTDSQRSVTALTIGLGVLAAIDYAVGKYRALFP